MSEQSEIVLDQAETLLTHLICADNDDATNNVTGAKRGVSMEEVDAGAKLQFDVMRPKLAYTFDMLDGDRLFTFNHQDLLAGVPEILGEEAETALLMDGGYVQWTGFRRMRKLPRGVWFGGRVGAAYEVHQRDIYPSGRSSYFRRVAAVSPSGAPIPCVIVGSNGCNNGSESLVIASSIVEDVGRTGCFTTSVSDAAGVVFPVPYGAQVDLFKLREAPLTHMGRRKAILHWVSRHVRHRGDKATTVAAHTRGVQEIEMDGFRIRLEANDQ